MTQEAGIPAASAGSPPTLVVDGSPELQRWINALTTSARNEAGDLWPHPHDDIPRSAVTVAAVWNGVETSFTTDAGQQAWSIAVDGLPPLPDPDDPQRILGTQTRKPDMPDENDPDPGSSYHNLLHRLLGNFH